MDASMIVEREETMIGQDVDDGTTMCLICLESSNNVYIKCRVKKHNGIFHNCMIDCIFCVDCFMKWINYKSCCIFCRDKTRMKRIDVENSIILFKKKMNESVPCPIGCLWTGIDIQHHWKHECLERHIKCDKCDTILIMRDKETHDYHCREIACPIPNCPFKHVFTLTNEQIEDPHYFPIFFMFHFFDSHNNNKTRKYKCTYKLTSKGMDYCTFHYEHDIIIQRFEI